jgi:hypothetical protein
MNFCIDCKHFLSDSNQCSRRTYVEPVQGRVLFYHAVTERTGYLMTDCGPDGKYFEPKAAQ